MRCTMILHLAAALSLLSLSGCRPAPAPQPQPAPHPVNHISISPRGYATQLAANGTELIFDLNASGYKDYLVQFQGAGPCGPDHLLLYGKAKNPARCTVEGQVNLSNYTYIVIAPAPNPKSPSAADAGSRSPETFSGKVTPSHEVPFRIVGCGGCPPNYITGVGSTDDPPPSTLPDPPPGPVIMGAPGEGSGTPSPAARLGGIPGQIEYSCKGQQAMVDPPTEDKLAVDDVINWQSFGGAGLATITFEQGKSPCDTPPQSPDYSCKLVTAGRFQYALAVPTTPNPPISCPLAVMGTIQVAAARRGPK